MNLRRRIEKLEAAVAKLAEDQAGTGKTFVAIRKQTVDGTFSPWSCDGKETADKPIVGPRDRLYCFEIVEYVRPQAGPAAA